MSKPPYNQAKRVFAGMLPEYYHRVDWDYPSPEVIRLTFWHFDYGSKTDVITGVIEMTYSSAAQDTLLSVVRTYPIDGVWP